jgi:hypothetical protein
LAPGPRATTLPRNFDSRLKTVTRSNASADPNSHRVLVAGESVPQRRLAAAWETPEIQGLLQRARQRFGNALCTCRPGQQLKLQIRTREKKSHLAVWPEEGPLHDIRCLFFRDEIVHRAAPQADCVLPAPAARKSPASEAEPRGPEYTTPPQRLRVRLLRPGLVVQPGELAMSIRGFANRLWTDASLCRWYPGWTRDWGRTRYQLLSAAEKFEVDGEPAESVLFVPRVYRPQVREEIERNWDSFVRSLTLSKATRILIAQVREIIEAKDGQAGRIHLRHLRAPVGLHNACHDFLMRECRATINNSAIAAPKDNSEKRPELIAILLVESSSRRGVWARAGWLMAVHPGTFVPAPNQHALQLVDAMISDAQVFEHTLSEAQSSRRIASDWLVRHVIDPHGKPVPRAALQVLDPGSTPDFIVARNAIAMRMQQHGIPTWSWKPTGSRTEREVPPLPPTDRVDAAAAQLRLCAVASGSDVEYCYGALGHLFNERKAA